MKLARLFPIALVSCALGGCQAPATAPAPTDENGEAVERVAANSEHEKAEAEDGCIHEDAHAGDGHASKAADGSCDHGAPGKQGSQGENGHYGDPFALADPKPLSDAIKALEGGGESTEPVLVSGTVANVCKKKGCWMVIQDGDATARVLMKDHAFSVPMDSEGRPAKVEGTLEVRTFTEAQVKHLAKDGGEDPDAVSGTRTEFQLTASGVAFEQT